MKGPPTMSLEHFLQMAERAERLARDCDDPYVADRLMTIAGKYLERAAALRCGDTADQHEGASTGHRRH
jgi:hypothetical protein